MGEIKLTLTKEERLQRLEKLQERFAAWVEEYEEISLSMSDITPEFGEYSNDNVREMIKSGTIDDETKSVWGIADDLHFVDKYWHAFLDESPRRPIESAISRAKKLSK